ncbi:DUF421 domain-containing protein [Planomicrobium sp. YIM 101495]|uniref:DUF421 domain-containing protein n=1 Tax=Planomicrobium sp. YIM 101495 TaxID=2665160 RepID=UPI0012B96D76|nr:YetF domain-containing protein [Planomicrobium sp. YIM 101495]MTD31699.1 DUF421 domain-containing protein [Planomicrobium sp. YIM 101495]
MFEITWDNFVRIITVGFFAYVALVFFLRVSGKRSLTKLNAFDLVVTVALGSILATILLDSNISLLEGMASFGLLIVLQYIVTFLSVRSRKFSDFIKAEPSLLYVNGTFLEKTLKKERVSKFEVTQAVRNGGNGSMEDVQAVVLETDGSMSVISGKLGDAMKEVESKA